MSQPPPNGPFDFEALRDLLKQLGLGDAELSNMDQFMQQLQKMQGTNPGVVFGMTNADLDPDAAWRTTITAAKNRAAEVGHDPQLRPEQQATVVDVERLAQTWLTPVTVFPETGRPARTSTRAGWIEATSEGWRSIIEPIIEGIGQALERGTTEEVPEEVLPMQQMLAPMMRHSASLIYRDRLQRELSALAADILTGTELGFNLLGSAEVILLPANVASFVQDLDVAERDITLYLLLREAARQRLFHSVGWLAPQMTALLRHYASEITISFDALAEQFQPESFQGLSLEEIIAAGEKVRGSFFKPASTPSQREILQRLEVLLALVEGWVDHVSRRAVEPWIPNHVQFDEILQRRRAAARPVSGVFAELLGLDLRPRLVRDAKNLWAVIEHDRGLTGRDAVWHHPDLLPQAEHLADPLSFTTNAEPDTIAPDALDEELRKLLGENGS